MWMSYSQHTPVVPLCLLVSGTKYPLTLLINLAFFDLFNILFIGVTPIIMSLNFSKILTCIGLVVKYPIMSFVGHHSIFNSFIQIKSMIKKELILMCLVRFIHDYFPFFSSIMEILLSWQTFFPQLGTLELP